MRMNLRSFARAVQILEDIAGASADVRRAAAPATTRARNCEMSVGTARLSRRAALNFPGVRASTESEKWGHSLCRYGSGTAQYFDCCDKPHGELICRRSGSQFSGCAWARQGSASPLRALDPPGALPMLAITGATADVTSGSIPGRLTTSVTEHFQLLAVGRTRDRGWESNHHYRAGHQSR